MARVLPLTVLYLTLAAVAASLAFLLNGTSGLAAALVAFLICAVAGLGGVLVGWPFRRPEQVVYQVLLTMAVRTGLPLALCILVSHRYRVLVDAGFIYYALIFYMVTLVAETTLATVASSRDLADGTKVS